MTQSKTGQTKATQATQEEISPGRLSPVTIAPVKISIGSLGGTISMTEAKEGEGVTPELSAKDFVAAIPELAGLAVITAKSLSQVPSTYLTFQGIIEALLWAKEEVVKGAEGVILTQGTDTLEETAFLLDLFWPYKEPLIVMGAMRSPHKIGAEGPANLLASVQTISNKNSQNRGVLVVMNDWIYEAKWVQKRHTANVAAFSSQIGPLGQIFEGKALFFHPPKPRFTFSSSHLTTIQTRTQFKEVLLWHHSLSETAPSLYSLLHDDHFDGVVLAGLGAGHVSDTLADTLYQLVKKKPVIMASRIGEGSTAYQTYGYIGGEIDLIRHGVKMAGFLSPEKARILLWVILNGAILNNNLESQLFTNYLASMTF